MTPWPKLFRRVAACVGALQLLTLFPVSAQVESRLERRPSIRIEPRLSEGERALVRARAALKAKNFERAYTEYRSALNVAPPTGPIHDEALRGFSASGIKLAEQRLKEGRVPEAERIAREVLSANPGYRFALDLLARASALQQEAPTVRSAPPPSVPRTGFAATPGPRATTAPQILRSSPPPTVTALPPQQTPAPTTKGKTTTTTEEEEEEEEEDTLDMPEEGPQATPATVRVKQPLVKVYFATDRRPSGSKGPSNYFGGTWSDEVEGDHLYTGVVTVSIPPVHKEGKVERPFKWWIIEFSEDPKKHVVLTDLKVEKGDNFYGALRTEYDRREPEKRSALVFIHGFNVSFDSAAYNTAQIAYDLDFDGVPMMYSWPSQGSVLAYDGDQESAEWSAPHLQTFLERVARESGALRIHVIAHSMGNRPLSRALAAIGNQPDIQPLFDNVIMAAPDVNAGTFAQLWPDIKNAAKRFTLYASSDDRALMASRKSKGGANFSRLGEGGPKIVVIPGIDTVDASGIDTSLLGHSYVDSCKPVMNDLQLLIAKGFAPLQRKLRDQYKSGLPYWAFPK